MVTDNKSFLMEIIIKGNIKKVSFMGRENIFGQMVQLMKGLSMKEADMDKEVGSLLEVAGTYTMVGTKKTKKVDMVDIYGRTDAYMKGTLKMT